MTGKYEIRVTNPERKQRILEPQQHITCNKIHGRLTSTPSSPHSFISWYILLASSPDTSFQLQTLLLNNL